MEFLYNLLVRSTEKLLPLIPGLSEKMQLFVAGRRNLFKNLQNQIAPDDKSIWFHTASLGEYEQAVPVIKKVREIFPHHKIIISFFSPSGFEVKKKNSIADVVTYLPLDTPENARQFLELIHPDWVIFIKYEFWPNFLTELKQRNIRTLLVSGAFRKDQAFFKPWGKWMRKYLEAFEQFFLQNESSGELLNSIGFTNWTVSGDTRFDRVYNQLEQDNQLSFIEEFKADDLCIVAGSTWPEDDGLLVNYINDAPEGVKFIIAPHALKLSKILHLKQQLKQPMLLYSEKQNSNLSEAKVFIIDTIGILTKIYSYADIAYVGGAAGNTGLHNILEPATFGVPIIIGENFDKFPEAVELQKRKGLFSVSNSVEMKVILDKLVFDEECRYSSGKIAKKFIEDNTGATKTVADYLLKSSYKEI